ncbi:MAG TPA: alpha/beta fold hydrolase [Myxococcaceae bacterium]|nr:alpha/beta fold hydrolase [Myxococcaceae bacterium]
MRIRVNGVSLYFDVDGAGLVPDKESMRQRPTVIALHGGPGGDHSWFKNLLEPLTRHAQVVYLDHRGNGRSDRASPETWNLATWADDVNAFCEALEIQKPVIFGASFGGFVAQAVATRHPKLPGKLVLAGTNARFHAERAFAMFAKHGGKAAETVARRFFADPSGDVFLEYIQTCLPLYRRVPPPALANPGAAVVNLDVGRSFISGEWHRFDFRDALSAVECPTLLLAGEEDPVMPIEGSEELAAHLPKHLVRFERFPGIGHEVISESPRAFELMQSFIQA